MPSRSQTCCRHFLLAQLRDGSHVVLGEDSTHARLQDLLQHYTACPLSPYGETLSQPLARQVRRAPPRPGPAPPRQSPGRIPGQPRLPRTPSLWQALLERCLLGRGSLRDPPSHRDRRG